MPKVTIAEDGGSFDCGEDDTLLRAALRAGIGFPYECNVGSCGTCRFQLLEGEVENLWPEAPAVHPRDAAKNRWLGCQTRARGDCEIKVRIDPAAVPEHLPRRFLAVMERAVALTHDMTEFHFRAEGAASFLPGQYALMTLPGVEGPRAYSMTGVANAEGDWSVLAKRVPGGAGSAWLFDKVAPGAEITLDGPYGHAWLRPGTGRPVVCLAGGAGLGPMLSIAKGYLADQPAAAPLRLFYGGRDARDMVDEALVRSIPGFAEHGTYVAVASEPGPDWTGATGFVHEHALAALGSVGAPDAFDWYMAGPPPMIEAARRALIVDHRVPVDQIHYDQFY